jgi:25S rRNA (adenine2142-N1)-methyltransferase
MYQLANEHWIKESKITSITYCRIEWITRQCIDYFFKGGMNKFDNIEEYLFNKYIQIQNKKLIKNIKTLIQSKVNILDVGSCYNPFKAENKFAVTAIDIAPYSSDVIQCDFLSLKVDKKKFFSQDKTILSELPKNSFDAVIFSLFLEYLPCPKQRYLCCKKAYNLLINGGILFIVTPDSKHEGANTKIINVSWKIILAKLGFMRIHYEKLRHIHCLVFRKCFDKDIPLQKINWRKISNDAKLISLKQIFIPQDFHQLKLKNYCPDTNLKAFKYNDKELITLFNELPSDY